jgi:hypothetical protein
LFLKGGVEANASSLSSTPDVLETDDAVDVCG